MKIYVLSRDTEVITVKLRWKQVRILHGPATVMKEFCSGCHCADVLLTQRDAAELCEIMKAWEGEQSDDR